MNLTNKVKDRILAFIVLSLGFAGYYATRSFPGQSGVFPRGIFVFCNGISSFIIFGTFWPFLKKKKAKNTTIKEF